MPKPILPFDDDRQRRQSLADAAYAKAVYFKQLRDCGEPTTPSSPPLTGARKKQPAKKVTSVAHLLVHRENPGKGRLHKKGSYKLSSTPLYSAPTPTGIITDTAVATGPPTTNNFLCSSCLMTAWSSKTCLQDTVFPLSEPIQPTADKQIYPVPNYVALKQVDIRTPPPTILHPPMTAITPPHNQAFRLENASCASTASDLVQQALDLTFADGRDSRIWKPTSSDFCASVKERYAPEVVDISDEESNFSPPHLPTTPEQVSGASVANSTDSITALPSLSPCHSINEGVNLISFTDDAQETPVHDNLLATALLQLPGNRPVTPDTTLLDESPGLTYIREAVLQLAASLSMNSENLRQPPHQ